MSGAFSRVPGRQSPFSLPVGWGGCHTGWAPPHTAPLEKPAGRECVVLLPTAPHRRHSGRADSSPHTTGHSAWSGKKGPVFLELLLGPCPHPGQVGASVPAEPALFICAPRGTWAGPPLAAASRKRGWGRRSSLPAGAALCRARFPLTSLQRGPRLPPLLPGDSPRSSGVCGVGQPCLVLGCSSPNLPEPQFPPLQSGGGSRTDLRGLG